MKYLSEHTNELKLLGKTFFQQKIYFANLCCRFFFWPKFFQMNFFADIFFQKIIFSQIYFFGKKFL